MMVDYFNSPAMFWFGFVWLFLVCQGFMAFSLWDIAARFTQSRRRALDCALYVAATYLFTAGAAELQMPWWCSLAADIALFTLLGALLLRLPPLEAAVPVILVFTASWLFSGAFSALEQPLLEGLLAGPVRGPWFDFANALCAAVKTAAPYLLLRPVCQRRHLTAQSGGFLLPLLLPLVCLLLFMNMVLEVQYPTVVQFENGRRLGGLAFSGWLMALVSVLGLLCLFLVLRAYFGAEDAYRLREQKSLLEQQLKAQETYVEQTRMRYSATRALRHDLNNHIAVLHGLLQRGEREGAQRYLSQLEETANSLGGAVQTASAAVDVLLADKLGLARQQGIAVACDVHIPPGLGVAEFDLCVLLANALDNAIAACGRQREGARSIDLKARQNGGFFIVDLINTCPGGEVRRPGGLGLKNIGSVAQKYAGTLHTQQGEGTFTLTVLLNLPAPEGVSPA